MFPTQGDILQQSDITLPRFLKEIDPLSPGFKITNRGVWTSECFALCVMIDLFGTDVYLESGIYKGQSLNIINNYFGSPDTDVVGIDINILDEISNSGLHYVEGNSVDVLPTMIKNDYDEWEVGVFIDGPKGWGALKLAEKVIDNDNVKFIGIHDSYLPVNTKDDRYKFRKHLEDRYHTWSTDDINFVREYNYLDNARWVEYLEEEQLGGILPYSKIKFQYNEDKYDSRLLKSYGPTITFIWRK